MTSEVLRFVTLVGAGLAVLMSIALAHLSRAFKEHVPGLNWWAGGVLTTAISASLFSLRDLIPGLASIVLANMLFVGGSIAFIQGTRRYFGLPLLRWPWVVAGIYVLLIIVFAYNEPDFRARTAASALVLLILNVVFVKDLWQNGSNSFGVKLLLFGLVVRIGLSLFRIWYVPSVSASTSLFSPTTVQIVSLLTATFWILLFSVGFILLAEERIRARLAYASRHDDLTGIFNRNSFMSRAEETVRDFRNKPLSVSMILFDLDNFKMINDQHGHMVGDRVIQNFAQHVRDVIGPHGVVGRFGGEEFVAILPGRDAQETSGILATMRKVPDATDLPGITFSAGVAAVTVETSNQSAQTIVLDLIKAADTALYKAKAAGRDQIAIA